MKSKIMLFLFCGIIIWGIVSCNSPKQKKPKQQEKPKHETLVFKVDDTLLEPAITDTNLKICISAPKNWKPIDNSLLKHINTSLGDALTQGLQIKPKWIFFNNQSQAMCVVSKLDLVDIAQGEKVLKELKEAYRLKLSDATVQSAIFLKDDFRVHQLMVNSSKSVIIKMLLDAPEVPVFEVDYVVPRQVYARELRAIESSIGSIIPFTIESQ